MNSRPKAQLIFLIKSYREFPKSKEILIQAEEAQRTLNQAEWKLSINNSQNTGNKD